ncbi:hypothetical protein A1Q_1861 [Vibrio campbellii HY01]|nr:hypothetical protein A1Q_1861 [Vibrio campbellii HY01]
MQTAVNPVMQSPLTATDADCHSEDSSHHPPEFIDLRR